MTRAQNRMRAACNKTTKETKEQESGKYQTFKLHFSQAGWRTSNILVEVSYKGFPSQSLWTSQGVLGVRVLGGSGGIKTATAEEE